MKFKNMEMSKKIIYAIAALIVLLFPVVIIVSCVTGDAQPLTNYVIGVFGLASIAVGFYYWKAKNENLNKYVRKYMTPDELKEVDTFIKRLEKGVEELTNE